MAKGSETAEAARALRAEVASLREQLREATLGRIALERAMRQAVEELDALGPEKAWSTLAQALGISDDENPWDR